MKKFPRKTTAMLLLLAIAATAGACGGSEGTADTTAAGTTSAPETTSRWLDDLPDDLDFGGEEVIIHVLGDAIFKQEVVAEEQTGEILNDTIYNRNRDIEERLNVKITPYIGAGWANYTDEASKIRASITAGDNQWQLIAGWASRIPSMIPEGLFIPLDDMQYLDFDAPWWSMTKDSKVRITGDKTYFMLGDASLITVLGGAYVLYQNDRIADEFKIPDVPQLVLDGKWTVDKLTEITKTVYRDIDGDGSYNDADLYGYLSNYNNAGDAFFVGCDLHSITASKGEITFTPDLERMSKALDKIMPLFHEGSTVNSYVSGDLAEVRTMFLNGLGLFIQIEVQSSYGSLRDCEDDFTILPFPKLDEQQDRYYVAGFNGATLWTIPTDNPNPDAAAAVLEAISAENYNKLADVYFQTCLQDKYARNEKTVEMLRVIRDSLYVDDEHLYKSALGNSIYIMRELLNSGSNTPASWYESNRSTIEAAIQNLKAALADNTAE